MNKKTIITTILVIILVAVGGIWFYFNKKPIISNQFKGTTLEVRDDNLALIGNYIKLEQNDLMVDDLKIVTVFFDNNTQIIKNIVETKNGSGFENPIKPSDQKQKTITSAELKADLKKSNLVFTVDALDNIYNRDSFIATKIEYTILIFK